MTMNLSRWQPFQGGSVLDQLHQFQQELNHVFNRWGRDGARALGLATFPPVNLWEDPDAAYVEAELPGFEMKDLDILVTGGNQLTLKGQRRPPTPGKGVWHRQERGYGAFERSLPLPFVVDPEKVEARFENGVLLVKLPKHESAKPRKINVKAE
jgi:HSP20 family protein